MRVAFSGCRDVELARHRITAVMPARAREILVGDCPTGVDPAVRRWAAFWQKPVRVFPADWETHGKAAGPIRNKAMVAEADLLIAFWDGASKGTLSAIREASKAGIPVRVYPL